MQPLSNSSLPWITPGKPNKSGEKTVLAGPIAFTAALGDIIDYISYDNVDPAIADLVAIPLP